MKTDIVKGTFHQVRYIFIFFIILLQACASTSGVRLEGNDFETNLPGKWEGYWRWEGHSGEQGIEITKIDENNKVHLTGYTKPLTGDPFTEVSGHIDNSILFLTWQVSDGECKDEYKMIKDNSKNPLQHHVQRYQGQYQSKMGRNHIQHFMSSYKQQ